MVDLFFVLMNSGVSLRRCLRFSPLLVFAAGLGTGSGLHAQAPPAASYPVDPIAAAGMTSGMPNGVTYRQAELMQIRTSAQGAEGEAVAASMARSVDETIEERNRELALQAAREKKNIKQDMANRLKFERAAESYNKVTANEMSTWKTQSGGVKVERNVPDAFLMSLIEEEEQKIARAAESRGERKRFTLFRKENDSGNVSGSEPTGGFLSALRPQRSSGEGAESEVQVARMAVSDTSEPAFVQASASVPVGSPQVAFAQAPAPAPAPPPPSPPAPAPVAASAPVPKPTTVPRISGAESFAGASPGQSAAASADRTPEPAKKGGGLFSLFQSKEEDDNSLVPMSNSESRGGGFFGLGRKKAAPEVGRIDASLFPDGAVHQAPTGSRLSGAYTASDVAAVPPSSTGSIELPGQTMEKSRGPSAAKPRLSLPSLPSIPSLVKSDRSSTPGIPTTTTVNSAGTNYYSVATTAQFMVYGADPMQSEVRALPAGSVVQMTKAGDQWASVRLPDGTEGVVQNKNLKPAAGGDFGGEFAASAQ